MSGTGVAPVAAACLAWVCFSASLEEAAARSASSDSAPAATPLNCAGGLEARSDDVPGDSL